MRSALCLFGKVGGVRGKDGLGNPVDFKACYESYKKHIIDINGCDVFIHSWSIEFEKQLRNLYQPKKAIFEPQIKFKNRVAKEPKDKRDEFICQSRWYSTKKVVTLKREYEEENNFRYDWVILGRFDLLFFVDFDFSKLEKNYFYVSHWNNGIHDKVGPDRVNHTLKNRRYLDLWFLSSSEFVDKLSYMYDHFYEYSITDPHRAFWDYVESFSGNPFEITKFIFYRWWDFEIYRIKCGVSK